MEEDVEGYFSVVSDMMIKTKEILCSNDMDFSTKQSQLVASMWNAVDDHDGDDNDFAFYHWFYELCAWIHLKFAETNPNKLIPYSYSLDKRDDRITSLACNAAFRSVQKSLENVVLNESHCNIDDIGKIIIDVKEEVLDSFNLLCEDLLIGKSWKVVGIRETIIEAADFAIDYINYSHVDKLCFPGDDKHRELILMSFKNFFIGDFGQEEDYILQENAFVDVMDDGLVGLTLDIQKIKDRLMGSNSNLDIIPIIGMGGIGKTTLARKVNKDPQIMPFFHLHAWIVVSRDFHERDVYLGLLHSIAPLPDEVYKEDTEQLAQRLYRRLKGWRYLIMLDDIWTKEAWDCIKLCFPNDNNGSRIMLTSRITEVASHVDHEEPPHFMRFLCLEDSWELFHKKVYGREICPPHMMNIGIQLVEKCQGLPLAIEVMAGHLSSISKTQDSWEKELNRVGFPAESTKLESLSNILLISFDDLPQKLKTCFLTMTIFPKNFDISVRKLIQMWTAMGFLSQNLQDGENDITSEEVALSCFKSLTDKSLIMIKEKKFDGKAKLCGVHDLLWDLSMREFRKQFSCDDNQMHAIHIHQSLLYFGNSIELDYPLYFEGFKLLRVLDILNQYFDHFPIDITNLKNLRYLALSTHDNIPRLIYKLSYLETLLNYHESASQVLPKEIWLLSHLKHLHVGTCTFLCEPSNLCVEGSSNSLLPNLLSLYNLNLTCCSNEILFNIPHLKQLGIVEHEQDDVGDDLLRSALKNIINLHQLEKFKLCCSSTIKRPRTIPDWGRFLPNTIKKLTLSQTHLPWSKMKTLSTLPNLEVLKLKDNAFMGEEWVMDDEEFLNLKYLLIETLMDLTFWNANNYNFPNLQHLVIDFCPCLYRIPKEFGEITTLELIDLEFFVTSLFVSAIEIQEAQMMLGNNKFDVRLGHILPENQKMGFLIFFVWLATRLSISN